MSVAVAAILEGMPEPGDLRMREHDGRCVITAGSVVLFDYAAGDVVMRNIALATLRQLGFRGRAVAAALGLSEAYVATLHNAARRDGSAALAMQDRRGTPGKVTAAQWEQARAWRYQGASDAEVGRRLGVAHTTVSRGLGPRGRRPPGRRGRLGAADPLFNEPDPVPCRCLAGGTLTLTLTLTRSLVLVPACRLAGPPAWPLPAEGALWSRYAGAMLRTVLAHRRWDGPGCRGRGAGGRTPAVCGQHELRAESVRYFVRGFFPSGTRCLSGTLSSRYLMSLCPFYSAVRGTGLSVLFRANAACPGFLPVVLVPAPLPCPCRSPGGCSRP